MPLVNNPFLRGNLVWKCEKCEEVFSFVDDGENHEKTCNGIYQPSVFTGYQITVWADKEQHGSLKKDLKYVKNFYGRKEMFEILEEILVFWKDGKPSEINIHFDARRA